MQPFSAINVANLKTNKSMGALLARIQNGEVESLTTQQLAFALNALLRAITRANRGAPAPQATTKPLYQWADTLADLLVQRWQLAGKFDERLTHYRTKEQNYKTTTQDLVRLNALERAANQEPESATDGLLETSKEVPPPEAMAIPELVYLTSARCEDITSPHKCVVRFPIRPGVQTCIVEKEAGTDFWDAIIFLPPEVPTWEPCRLESYETCMRMLEGQHKARIDKLVREDSRVSEWSKSRWDQPPFLPASTSNAITSLGHALLELVDADQLGIGPLDEIAEELCAAAFWRLPLLAHRVATANPKLKRHWAILHAWEGWERDNLSWEKRYWQLEKICPDKNQGPKGVGRMRGLWRWMRTGQP